MDERDSIGGMPGRRPGFATVILWAIVTSAAVSVGIAYAQHFVDLPGLEPAAEPAPDLTAISVEAARRLTDAHGLVLATGEARESAEVPEGDVVDQTPDIGQLVAPGGTITVVLSSGPALVEVPDLRRRSVDDARATLERLGLVVGTVSEGEGEPGMVVASDPPAGEEVAPGSAIALTAAPEAPPGVDVPDLTGMRLSEARTALEEAGLGVGRVRRRYDDRRGPNRVLSQEPDPGTRVEPGTEIEIIANEGV